MRKFVIFFALVAMSAFASGQTKPNSDKDELLSLEQQFTDAVLENDAKAIEQIVADDWVIIDADGGMIDKASFLAAIKSGALKHSSMSSKEIRIRIYNETAVVTALTTAKGKYMDKPFTSTERATDVFVKKDGRWQCILSHLTRIAKK